MLIKELNYLFCDQASVCCYRVTGSFFELYIFFVQEGYGSSYQVEREKRLSSVEIEVIIFCQFW
jgi:hypothetical protein